ncbi:MAG TPA: cyclic nucleotide-binding domain-containing protein, partial [Vicinamibacterales bacterium]
VLSSFDGSAITYTGRFWVDDFEHVEVSRDQVRSAIYYAFQRHNIEIPWPIQVEYRREWPETDGTRQIEDQERLLAEIDLFETVPAEIRREVAEAARLRVFGHGEMIVRQGDPGQSMFLVKSGAAVVLLEPSGQEVARIGRGGYFGEMSLLTGDSRSASVRAAGDVAALEIDAELFRRIGSLHPTALEQIAIAAAARRVGLDARRSAAGGSVAVETSTLVARMRRFLRF